MIVKKYSTVRPRITEIDVFVSYILFRRHGLGEIGSVLREFLRSTSKIVG